MSDLESEQLISTEATPFELTVKPARGSPSRLKLSLLLAAALVSVCAVSFSPAASGADGSISVPWRAGNAALFQTGMPEEKGAQAAQGALPVRVYRPAGTGPFPFVVLLHGCGGLHHEAMWRSWAEPWAEVFRERGIGTAVVDSFTPRGVDQVCTGSPGAWAVQRADDAYSVRAWLAEQPYADDRRIAVMGMSNGGRTVLAARLPPSRHTLHRRLRLFDRRAGRPSPLRTTFPCAAPAISHSRRLPTQRHRRSDPSATSQTRSRPCDDASSSLSPGPSRDALVATRRSARP